MQPSNQQKDKDKKISDLRNLLGAAKSKIQQLKQSLTTKQTMLVQQKSTFQKKITTLQQQSSQIIKQYEQRLLRMKKLVEESEEQKLKYQLQAQAKGKGYQSLVNGATVIGNVTMRVWMLNGIRDNNEAVQELYYQTQMDKIGGVEQLVPIVKAISKINELLMQTLHKKRQCRISSTKKQSQLKKSLQQCQSRLQSQIQKTQSLQSKISASQKQWREKYVELQKSKSKMTEQIPNVQLIKQMFLKYNHGSKQVAHMAIQMLAKVLKMNEEEVKGCKAKIAKSK